ncbi:MAG: hypothetical protein EPO36_08765 [Chloroflexota bacterium]|nr:MAG: hypothetical protein EPO36_08765 [Chloroflexota bacterium]
MSPTAVLLVGLVALLVLIPTRRLMIAGWQRQSLTMYYLAMVLLGLAVAVMRGPATFLVPILLVAYLAPFVTFRDGVDRLLGRPPRPGPVTPGEDPAEPRPVKDVTPPESRDR